MDGTPLPTHSSNDFMVDEDMADVDEIELIVDIAGESLFNQAQPAGERINSEFNFVIDARRNRLEHGKAEKLVALFHNLRLIHRMRKVGYSEPAVGWNDNDEEAGVTKYGVCHYDGAKKVAAVQRPSAPALPAATQADDAVLNALM
ncbi:hypothetical protein AB1Y20_014181 [Prymnesium parvum]|uniref:Uncharacterized protein n=1 Tax=Prymnesium parvum TaxID=97485 RepID=A0AB34ICZ4_PRYPA